MNNTKAFSFALYVTLSYTANPSSKEVEEKQHAHRDRSRFLPGLPSGMVNPLLQIELRVFRVRDH